MIITGVITVYINVSECSSKNAIKMNRETGKGKYISADGSEFIVKRINVINETAKRMNEHDN